MADKEEDLDELGLIGHSYDHLFAIRKRLYKISDITLPMRGGLTYTQIISAVITLFISFVVYGMIVMPLTAVFSVGGTVDTAIMVITLFGPTILVCQKVVAPMPSHKTITGYLRSLFRFHTDDPVYRRGRPIDTPTTHRKGRVRHNWVVWEPAGEFLKEFAADTALTRLDIERTFTGNTVNLDEEAARISSELKEHEEMLKRRNNYGRQTDLDLRGQDSSGVIGL